MAFEGCDVHAHFAREAERGAGRLSVFNSRGDRWTGDELFGVRLPFGEFRGAQHQPPGGGIRADSAGLEPLGRQEVAE